MAAPAQEAPKDKRTKGEFHCPTCHRFLAKFSGQKITLEISCPRCKTVAKLSVEVL